MRMVNALVGFGMLHNTHICGYKIAYGVALVKIRKVVAAINGKEYLHIFSLNRAASRDSLVFLVPVVQKQ